MVYHESGLYMKGNAPTLLYRHDLRVRSFLVHKSNCVKDQVKYSYK